MNIREWIICGLQGSCVVVLAAVLFYDSLWACIPGIPFLWFFYKWKRQELAAHRKQVLSSQFREGIRSLSAALQAGYSVENALAEAAADLRLMEWKKPYMVREFEEMQYKIAAGKTVEQVLEDFAVRSGMDDAEVFADIFCSAKRGGQNLTQLIGNTVRIIGEKLEMEQEIETILASRTYEQSIMSLMPLGMLLYLRLTSGGFLEVLYTSTAGRLLMSVCLCVYLFVWRLGKRMVRIEI